MLKVNCGLRARIFQRCSQCRCQRRIVVVAYPHLYQIAQQIDLVSILRLMLQQIHKGRKNRRIGMLEVQIR